MQQQLLSYGIKLEAENVNIKLQTKAVFQVPHRLRYITHNITITKVHNTATHPAFLLARGCCALVGRVGGRRLLRGGATGARHRVQARHALCRHLPSNTRWRCVLCASTHKQVSVHHVRNVSQQKRDFHLTNC